MNLTYMLIISFLCGIGSSLFLATPFGRVAMFDLASYILGPCLYVFNYKRFTRHEQRILLLALLWLVGTVYTNWWRQEPFDVTLKGNAIVFNVWCMIVVGIWLVKRDMRTFLWFTIGNSLSMVISLYYFQNGAYLSFAEQSGYLGAGGMQAYLHEKQVWPIYFRFLSRSILFPLVVFVRFAWMPVIVTFIISAFFLLFNGGSRSSFAVNLLCSTFFIGYAYFRRLSKIVLNNFVVMSLLTVMVAAIIFSTYRYLAVTGQLGDDEKQKYTREMVDSDSGVLGSRDDIIRAWPFLKDHPFVGSGSSGLDRWGYMEDDFRLPGHSALVGAWVQNGILGLIFWSCAAWQIMFFVQKRVLASGCYAPFLVLMATSLIWAILFSPFGGYRGEVSVFLALCAVAKDPHWLAAVQMQLQRRSCAKQLRGVPMPVGKPIGDHT